MYLFFHDRLNHHTFLGTTYPNGIFEIFTWIKFQWTLHYKELAWAKIVLRVKSTKIYTVQNGKKLWEFSKCS